MSGSGRGVVGIDTSVPNVARIYDYILGGKDNFAADRQAAQRLLAALPDIAGTVRDNRSFIGRVVRSGTLCCQPLVARRCLACGPGRMPWARDVALSRARSAAAPRAA